MLFKSETEIQFTITLDNPKAESIDAIELTCDDPKSQILMDGKYENIQYSEDKTIIVNWSQENPYKKTYQIRTTSEETIQTLKVVDIKVNGEWQNKELSNDELKIYKIENNDIAVFTVDNTIEEYSFKVLSCSNVKSYDVIFNDRYIEADETGTYRVNEDGTVRIRYVYDFNGIEVEWEVEKDIELFGFESGYFDPSCAPVTRLYMDLHEYGVRLVFTGTDVKNDYVDYIYSDGIVYECRMLVFYEQEKDYSYGSALPENLIFRYKYDWNYVLNRTETTETNFYLKYNNNLYQIIVDAEFNISLKLVK